MASELLLLFSTEKGRTTKTINHCYLHSTKPTRKQNRTEKEEKLNNNNYYYRFPLNLKLNNINNKDNYYEYNNIRKLFHTELLLSLFVPRFETENKINVKNDKFKQWKIINLAEIPCLYDNTYRKNYESFDEIKITSENFNGCNTNQQYRKKDQKYKEFNGKQLLSMPMDIFYNCIDNYYRHNKINTSSNDTDRNTINEENSIDVCNSGHSKQFNCNKNLSPCSENCYNKSCCHKYRLDIKFDISVLHTTNTERIICCFFMCNQFEFCHKSIESPVPTSLPIPQPKPSLPSLLLHQVQSSVSNNWSQQQQQQQPQQYQSWISSVQLFFLFAIQKITTTICKSIQRDPMDDFHQVSQCWSNNQKSIQGKIHSNERIQQYVLSSFNSDKMQSSLPLQLSSGIQSENEISSAKSSTFNNLFEFFKDIFQMEKYQFGFSSRISSSTCYFINDIQKFVRFILPIVILFNMMPAFNAECDQTFVSRVGGPQNGTFTAPLLHNPTNHSRQCLYIFLAGPGQRVEVVFTSFNLRGNPPDGSAVGELPACVHEYMDIYAEVQSSDPADLINSPFGGRYCGPIPPRRRISMYRAIALSFFTSKNTSMPDLFEGRFTFINASEYEIGIPIAGSPCSYTVTPSMSINKTGALISPTYPGAYPKDMSCTYQFLGESNQRVRLEFRDFDLFFGGPHCPFDYVKIYDGPDNSSALIGTYCGQQRNLVLYSSESSLFVHFFTLPRTANTQNRGFKGIYEFSESFVKLDFIRQNDGIHIRGSECDQKILSKKESTGHVFSPNYPYPYIPKTVCRYFIYGMQDAQHLERVRLEFSIFEIPKVENKDKSESNCSDGYLKVYLKGQETADAYDKFDYELCGNETTSVVSDGPRLAMVFSSGELQGRGFKAKYTFETEYKIPGTAAPDGSCSFTYRSTSKKKGEFNSPRYPSNYPSDTNCSFLFLALPNEQVTIVFDHFKIKADNVTGTTGAYGTTVCFEDWLEMFVIYRDGPDRFLGRYCHLTAPGPVESPKGSTGIRIMLHTDQESVASGFKARYVFETTKLEFGDCGGNYSGQDSGVITSPGYPAQYKGPGKGLASHACNWYITARNGYRISVNFEFFSVEGDPPSRGCPAAVLRLWTNLESEAPPIELCGEKGLLESWHHISQGQSVRISFTTTDKTIGAQGFRIVWTEIQDSGPGPPSSITLLCESTYHFQCNSGYCIADRLRCDGIKNCGPGDDSDELHCIMEVPKEDHDVLIICSIAGGSFLICLLCILCHRRRRRRHRRQLGLHRNAAHYDSTTSATGLSSSRRHLQSGSLSGSLHGINSGTLIIPPAPLPPTSVPPPPHICIAGVGSTVSILDDDCDDDDDDNDDDNEPPNLYINDIHYDDDDPLNGESV